VTKPRPVRTFGDGAVLIDVDSIDEAHTLAAAIGGDDGEVGIEDVIVGFRSVTVVVDPLLVDLPALGRRLASRPASVADRLTTRRIEIAVALDGPDLDEVATLARLAPGRVVELLTGTDLQVAFVGFAPGFAYLVGLPPDLAAVPRRSTPRPAVPGGSVALAGGFAGIYPQSSPGGWQLVGRTAMRLFDPLTPPYSALRAGDRVRLRTADVTAMAPATDMTSAPDPRPLLRSDAVRTLLVETAGLLSLVQDRGRPGVAGLGVPRAGAADPYGLRLANRLVGNPEDAAAIETTARGPSLRFSAPAHVAVVGTTDVQVDGLSVPADSVVPVGAGQTVTTGDVRRGLRSYIAVGGGIEIPTVLGSRSSDVLCGLGTGPLRAGDVLGFGRPGRPAGRRQVGAPNAAGPLRVMVGPDVFPTATVEHLISTVWEVDASSDRIGIRLTAGDAPPMPPPTASISSRGMVTGAIQVPPDGRPIVLLCDHATVGGYPVIATVVSADLGILGQLGPGAEVRFEPVDLAGAVRARVEREKAVAGAVVGWYPVRAD
jgi:KipI family sensor histidine kinase inhibitor